MPSKLASRVTMSCYSKLNECPAQKMFTAKCNGRIDGKDIPWALNIKGSIGANGRLRPIPLSRYDCDPFIWRVTSMGWGAYNKAQCDCKLSRENLNAKQSIIYSYDVFLSNHTGSQ